MKNILAAMLVLMGSPAFAASFEVQSALFGYMRGVYGNGSRYGAINGYDRIGLSQFAVGVEAKMKDNYRFVGLFAADVLSTGGSGANVGIKDTFIDIASVANSDFGLTLGAQPFMMGLKANGYPGDHSIQPSIEFMNIFGTESTAGDLTRRSFAVSQQAGPSGVITYNMNKENRVVVGAFDTDEQAPTKKRGSAVHQNIFGYFKSDRLAIDNLKFFAGWETRFQGVSTNGATEYGETYPIYDVGAAYKIAMVDVSVEYISVDKHFSGTKSNETVMVAEAEGHINSRNSIYIDYGNAKEMEVTTWRGGYVHHVNEHLLAQAELSQDVFGKGLSGAATAEFKQSSFDVMMKYSF